MTNVTLLDIDQNLSVLIDECLKTNMDRLRLKIKPADHIIVQVCVLGYSLQIIFHSIHDILVCALVSIILGGTNVTCSCGHPL